MVNLVKCKAKTQECDSEKVDAKKSKNQQRQQGGDAQPLAGQVALVNGTVVSAKEAAKAAQPAEDTDCPLNKKAEAGKKEGSKEKKKGAETEDKVKCAPAGAAPLITSQSSSSTGIEAVAIQAPLEVTTRKLPLPVFTYSIPKLALDRSDLKFPKKTEEEKESEEQDKKSVITILSTYQRANQELLTLLEKQQGTALQSSNRIREAFESTANYVMTDYRYLDNQLLDNYRMRIQDLEFHRTSLLNRIGKTRLEERLAIFLLSASGRLAISLKINTVQASIDNTVKEIIAPYKNRIDSVVKSSSKSLESTSTSLTQWQANINTTFPVNGTNDLENAANEGRRQTADCGVKEEISKVKCKTTEIPAKFKTIVDPFEKFARQSIAPPMRQEAKMAEACGFKALDAAVSRSILQLEAASKGGRRSVKKSIAATKRQLTTHLNASRSALREQADAQQQGLKQEAETATKRVSQAHESQKQGLTGSLTTYRQSIIDAAPDGVSSAQTVATSGSGETRTTFKSLRKSHINQCEQIENGSREGLSKSHSRFWQSSNEAVVIQKEAANQQASDASDQLSKSTTSRVFSMRKLKGGVKQSVDIWSMSLSVKYAKQIQTTKNNLVKCEKGFAAKLNSKQNEINKWLAKRNNLKQFFKANLDDIATKVKSDIKNRVIKLADEFDDMIVHDAVITDAVRGVTAIQGKAVREVYDGKLFNSLYSDIRKYTSGDDKRAIYAYLSGNEAKGAEYELKASIGFFNDDEARIRKTLRSLDDENLKKFLKRPGVEGTLNDVRDNLGGVDLKVFNTLVDAELPHIKRLARADAYDLEEKLKSAHTREQINTEIANFYSNNPDRGYGDDVSNEALRQEINNQMAVVRNVKNKDGKPVTGKDADKAMEKFITEKHQKIEQIEQINCRQHGCYKDEKREKFHAAQEDRSKALIHHGVNSKQDKIALLGIEANRAGGGKMENIDKSLVDPRLNPNVLDPNHYQDGVVPPDAVAAYNQALKERKEVLEGVAKNYGNSNASSQQSVNDQVINLLKQGQSKLGKQVINGLVTETFPSAQTSSMLIEYAAGGYFDGTNETLMKQATTRLDREQIAAADANYGKRTGKSLWKLVASETSGQDFLDMELAWMGQPRNDREKAEVALFAIHQQKRETGTIGKALMSGSRSESIMLNDEKHLQELVGGNISFSKRGDPPAVTIRNPNFDKRGRFTGEDRSDLLSTANSARASAENYAKNIDEWADGITTTIAIIGAVVATVVTGGGASPLLAAAIAGGFGLAGMAAKQAIKGGRYGWEEALTDLGMTGVQMVTAGLGQKLQAVAAASKSMGPIQQALLPAVVTGGLDSMGQAVLNEGTWKDGFGKGMEEVLAGTFKGVLTSTVATLGAQALQKIPIGRAAGAVDDLADDAAGATSRFRTLGDLSESTNWASRSAAQSLQSGGSSFLSTGAGIGFDALRGKYKGSMEDAFWEMSKSGGQAAFQGVFEGAGEAWRDKNKIKYGLYTRPGWMDPDEFAALKAPPSRSQQGTAAAVEGSRFRGDLHTEPVVNDTHLAKGLKDLTSDGGFLQGKARLDTDGDGMRVMLRLDDGNEIPVHFKTVEEMTLTEKGVPVAEFHGDGDGFQVHVSSKADPEMIQRAMVHELTEIRHLKKPNANTDDVLKPGGATQKRPEGEPQLSPHDRARIAELEYMQRQLDIAKATQPVDHAKISQLSAETMTLLTHLGVVNDTPGATHRRDMLNEHLSSPRMQDAIQAAIQATRKEPRFQYRGADREAALSTLIEQWQQHRNVGDTETADRLLHLIRRQLMRMEHISTDRRLKDQQQKLTESIDQHLQQPKLIEAMKSLLENEAKVSQSRLANDPVADDPHGAQAVRREFGDNPNFQDWSTFRDKFFATFKTADANDPLHMDHAYHQWSTGGYVNETTQRLRSVMSDISRPHPDFTHQWKAGHEPQEVKQGKLDAGREVEHSLEGLFKSTSKKILKDGDLSDALQQKIKSLQAADPLTPLTVTDAAELRYQLLQETSRIDAILNNPAKRSKTEFDRLKILHHALEHQAIKLSETLGEAAAKRVAELEEGNWEPVPLEGKGSGLPDVVYRNRDTGKLLILEAKGGGSQLGTRLDITKTKRVEQGTRAYLESLANTMLKSTSETTRNLGEELLQQLSKTDGVDYRLVKQKFDAQGNPQLPEVGRFDIGDVPNAAETHTNAAAIPDSLFHGEANTGKNTIKDIDSAADRLIMSGEGIGADLVKLNGQDNTYSIERENGAHIKVRLELVPADQLPLHQGDRANAEWQSAKDPALDYVIRVSDQMDAQQIGRALAHDFREVQQDALAGGGTQEVVTQNERGLDLNRPHGKARLEEIIWLGQRIKEGDPRGAFKEEMQLLLKHLGAEPHADNENRRVEVIHALLQEGQLTPEIWLAMQGSQLVHRFNANDLLTQLTPYDGAAITRAIDNLQATGNDLMLVRMKALQEDIQGLMREYTDTKASFDIDELIRQRTDLLNSISYLGIMQLVQQHVENGKPVPSFKELLASRNELFKALGVDPPSLSRQDLDIFIKEIFNSYTAGNLLKGAGSYENIYARYSDSVANKGFSSDESAQSHRQQLLDILRESTTRNTNDRDETAQTDKQLQTIPDNIHVDTQNSKLNLLLEVMGLAYPGEAENDFFHFDQKQESEAEARKAKYRIYINPTADTTLPLLRELLHSVISNPDNDAYKIKTHSDPNEIKRRAEGLVIYAESVDSRDKALSTLLEIYQENPHRFIPAVPRMSQPVVHGISVANEPGGIASNESFGGWRRIAIYAALTRLQNEPEKNRTLELFRDLVLDEFKKRHIDIDQPHRNLND